MFPSSWRRSIDRECSSSRRFRHSSDARPRLIVCSRPRVEILEDRLTPSVTVQFGLASESLLETVGTFTIPVLLSSTSPTATTVPFTLGGTAASRTDYSGVTASGVVIPAGQIGVNITGTLLAPSDGVKTLTFTLGTPTGATLGATTVNTMTIADPTATPTTLSIANSSAIEPGLGGTTDMDFTVTRTGDLTSQITVGYTTVAGSAQPNTDFTPETGTTIFDYGSATATISIPILHDGVINTPSLTFSVQLTGIVNVVGPPVTFAAPSAIVAPGVSPIFVVTGDLNGDGTPDIVVANSQSSNVSVLLNTTAPGATTPTFAAQQTFAVGSFPISVAIGDLNGDGKPDLVVANQESNSVSVLLNTTAPGASTPTFAAQQTFAAGNPTAVSVADLNGDGELDIVVADFNSGVSVLLNTAAPGATTLSFAPAVNFATGNRPESVAVTDFNGDGKPDIVAANYVSNTVSVLRNTTAPGATTPTFATQQTFAAGSEPISVAVADFNGDGKPDIVVASGAASGASGGVSVLLNTTAPGSATLSFAAQQAFLAGGNNLSVAIADLNGDGKPDLVVARNTGVSVLLDTTATGAAAVSFAAEQDFLTGTYPFSVAIADFNGDGEPDLVSVNTGVSVLMNTTVLGAATMVPDFPEAATLATGSVPFSVTIGDLNGDAKPDIAIANVDGNSVSVLLNTTAPGAATPTFAPKVDFTTGAEPRSVAMADLTGDGKLDLVTANYGSNSLSVLLNTMAPGATTPSFTVGQNFTTGTNPFSVAVADLNGDGKPDIVVANLGSNGVSVLLNTTAPGATTPTFAAKGDFSTGTRPYSVAIGDLNGDGKPDIVVANVGSNSVSVLFNTTVPGVATPGFAPEVEFATGTFPNSVAIGDMNGDGKPDIVVASGAASGASGGVSVLLNTTAPGTATPSFAPKVDIGSGGSGFAVAVTDLNGDGKPDIVVPNISSSSNGVSVLLNTTAPGATTPTFAARQEFITAAYPVSVAAADLNGDGKPDLAVVIQNTGAAAPADLVTILLNTPVTIPGNTATGTIIASAGIPTVQFSSASETVNESTGAFSITVTLSAASSSSVSVPFTLGGTAVSGTDYSGVTTSPLSFAAGNTTATITGTLLPDPGASPTLIFTLGTPTNAMPGATTVNTMTITEPAVTPTVQFSVASETVNESAGTFSITVALSAESGSSVSIPFRLGGTAVSGTDYSGVTTSPLSIAAGNTTATITGTLVSDPGASPTLIFTLGTPTGATLGATTVNTLTITEPAVTPTVQFSVASETVNESAGTFSITVALSAESGSSVSIPFRLGGTAVSGTDYSGVTTSPLSIAAGNTTATITGTLLLDPGVSKTLIFTLGRPTNATLGATTVNTLTITESAGTTVSVSGTVFFDYNVNGVLDPGEPGLARRTIFLDLNNSGNLNAADPTTVTAADGSYQFTGLAPGTHTVRELIQYDNVDVTGAGASRVVVANANMTGINIGNLLYNPAFPVYAVAGLYTPHPNADATMAYVHGLYQAILNRPAEPQGLAYWVSLLQSGMTEAAVDNSFINSKEHRQNEVAYYYENFLGAAPDAASAVWVNELMNGENEEEVVQGILTLPAYTTLHPTDAEFVTDLYFHLLGRQADSAGLAHWEQLLAAGSSREAIVADFFQSTNESAMLGSHGFFAAFLHRAPDPMGDAFWMGQLQTQTQTFGQVAAGYFWTTPEFQNDANRSVP